MNKILIAIVTVVMLVVACKKDKGSNSQLLLGKIYKNGLLSMELNYSLDKKLIRKNNFNTINGVSEPTNYRLYEYNDKGLLTKVADFNKDDQFVNKFTLQYDVNNRLTRINDLAADNSIQSYFLVTHNAAGLLSFYEVYIQATSKKSVEGEFTYDAQGRLAHMKKWYYSGTNKLLRDSAEYFWGNKQIPSWWTGFELLPVVAAPNSNTNHMFYDIFCDSVHYRYIDAPPTISNITYTNKQFNNAGLVISQNISTSTTYITTTTDNKLVTYEYIEP